MDHPYLQGQSWLQMDPPLGTKLRAVSAGDGSLWALDTSDRLYLRKEGLVPTWHHVHVVSSSNEFVSAGVSVKSISASGNELWAVLDNVNLTATAGSLLLNYVAPTGGGVGGVVASGATTLANQYYGQGGGGGPFNGVLARLRGVTTNQPTGAGWDIVIGVSDQSIVSQTFLFK